MKIENDIFENQERERKRKILIEFLSRLAADPSLKKEEPDSSHTLTEMLYMTKYPIKKELQYDYSSNKFTSTEDKLVIDIALLLNLLFKEKGLNCTSDDLMRHVLEGVGFEQFLQQALDKAF